MKNSGIHCLLDVTIVRKKVKVSVQRMKEAFLITFMLTIFNFITLWCYFLSDAKACVVL